jgi:hypothetical protein
MPSYYLLGQLSSGYDSLDQVSQFLSAQFRFCQFMLGYVILVQFISCLDMLDHVMPG